MNHLYAKIRMRGSGSKYRKLLSTNKSVFAMSAEAIQSSISYHPQTLLEEGEWYFIKDFSQSEYAIDVLNGQFDSVDFAVLKPGEVDKVDYIFVKEQDKLYFQSISRSRLVRRKAIMHIGGDFRYDEGFTVINLNILPDAIYVKNIDTLYFRKLESITKIFKGIDQLYREATEDETKSFLGESFIALKNDYTYEQVKTANRKKIAMALDTLSHMQNKEKNKIFSYIKEYCPSLKYTNNSFEIGNETDLKMLLWGIEQRFFTTPVGNEKRIANSVIALKGD